jgi:hypothetical protein
LDNGVFDIPDGVDEIRGEMETFGPWGIPKSYTALVIEYGTNKIYGVRKSSRVRQSGYDLEGYVSIGGKQRSCFTSSVLFEREDGSLVSVACWYLRSVKTENAS